jgi:hypothetical protein
MPAQEVLILAMTYMRSGICTAGFLQQPDETTHLHWVRPVKEHDTLRVADLTDASGRVAQVGDVLELDLKQARPEGPHTEDWISDFIYHRPRLLRRLEGEHRARFLTTHLDRSPQDVIARQTRSLCLVKPDDVWARFSQEPQSGQFEARLGFRLGNVPPRGGTPFAPGGEDPTGEYVTHEHASSPRGIPVTDLKWRALGRAWLGQAGELAVSGPELASRLHATDIYLALGLSRGYQNEYWLLVIGVHVVPDYEAVIDYRNL